jgi:acyl-CoA synthetase (AMP-forming)/AMP-acid ligase II
MPQSRLNRRALRALTLAAPSRERYLVDGDGHIAFSDIAQRTGIDNLARFENQIVAIACRDQFETVLALLDLDGIAKRVLLCTGNVIEYLPSIIQESGATIVLTDRDLPQMPVVRLDRQLPHFRDDEAKPVIDTEWVLFTSGTTGQPKMVVHSFASLVGPLDDGLAANQATVWSTFYDIRRYGGLTILLRALLGGGSMILSAPPCKPVDAFLQRVGHWGVTHMSGTPSHWRKALMTPMIDQINPKYVRLSGEIADQTIIDQLKRQFPASEVAHAFASTEAGVAFDVRDGRAGFPASYINNPAMKADLRVIFGTLHIRSSRTASTYIGRELNTTEGYVNTGDLVTLEGDRYYFQGRAEGVINVGGQKVFPEEIEAVLASHPAVQACQVYSRKNPIIGQLVAANVVLREPSSLKIADTLKAYCAEVLPAYKVPVSIKLVDTITLSASGKIARA